MLFDFVKFDLYNGIVQRYKKILALFFLYVMINLTFANLTYAFIQNGLIQSAGDLNVGDYIMYYLSGISEYIPSSNEDFPFPFLWMFQILCCCFFCLHYPLEDLHTSGKHRLILCKSRTVWWISKCIWISVNVIVYYAVAYAASIVVGVLFGARTSCNITNYTAYLLKLTGILNDAPYDGRGYFLFIPFVVIAICTAQMTLSLLIKVLYSFVVTAIYLLASAYFKTPYLIGNFAMLARSELIDTQGFEMTAGVIGTVIVIGISLGAGILIFRNQDIL